MYEDSNLQIWSSYAYSKGGQSSLTRRQVFLIMSLNAIFEACCYEMLPTLGTKVQLGLGFTPPCPLLGKISTLTNGVCPTSFASLAFPMPDMLSKPTSMPPLPFPKQQKHYMHKNRNSKKCSLRLKKPNVSSFW